MKSKFYKQFGLCYNNGDFKLLSSMMHKDCMYKSFDFLYVLKGKDKVLQEIENQSKKNLECDDENCADAYMGYYSKSFLWLKTITECLVIASRDDKKSMKILSFNIKRGKISCIMGHNPDKLEHIRGKKI